MGQDIREVERLLEFDRIKEKWAGLAYTAWAKEKIGEAEPFLSESVLLHALAETTEARLLLEKGGTPPPVSLNGVEELVTIAGKGGMSDCRRTGADRECAGGGEEAEGLFKPLQAV